MLYLDASAIVKLVGPEAETKGLVELLRSDPDVVSSALARVEVTRAVRRAGGSAERLRRPDEVLDRIAIVEIDQGILHRAAELDPTSLRTLDTIHLSTAMLLASDLAGLVTYDSRLAAAATDAGVAVLAPS